MLAPYQRILSTIVAFFLVISIGHAEEKLIVEPDMGRSPILSLIDNSTSSINLVMYGLTDKQFITALTKAANRGENVQVLLEPTPYKAANENDFAFQQFKSSKVRLQTPNPEFTFTHQKTLLIDQNTALIMTFNFTNSTFNNSRNFALLITNPTMIKEIQTVFSSDWQHSSTDVHDSHLIWAPNNSRDRILNFIHDAKSEIDVYAEGLSDYQIAGALAKAARAGIKVNILTSLHPHASPSKELNYLTHSGAHVRYDDELIIHAKMIMVDRKRAILGSINLTRNSIDYNRELAVITEDTKVISGLGKTFDADWQMAS